MVFTVEDGPGSKDVAQVIEIAVGAFVYRSTGEGEQENQYVEWGDLTPEQQQGLKDVKAILSDCFNKSMVSSAELLSRVEAAA